MRILQRAAGFAYALVSANYQQVAALTEFGRRGREPQPADTAAASGLEHETLTRSDRDRRRHGGLRIPRA